MHIKSVRLKMASNNDKTDCTRLTAGWQNVKMASTSERTGSDSDEASMVELEKEYQLAWPSSFSQSSRASCQSSHLITTNCNQNQFHERTRKRNYYHEDTSTTRHNTLCSSTNRQHQSLWSATDCYRQISAICKRHKSNMSQVASSCSSSFFFTPSSSLIKSLMDHRKHNSSHLHLFIFILSFTIILHCVSKRHTLHQLWHHIFTILLH